MLLPWLTFYPNALFSEGDTIFEVDDFDYYYGNTDANAAGVSLFLFILY